jgi:Winged helix-turn helix
VASRGQAARCRLDEQQLAELDAALEAGPLAAGWEDQRWTLARVRDLVARRFRVACTIPGIWYLLRRRGWSCQLGARRAIERDDGAVEVWKKETWPRIKAPRRPSAAGSSSRTSAGIWSVLKRGVLANLATASFAHLVQVIRHGLKKIQYRPGLIEGWLAGQA